MINPTREHSPFFTKLLFKVGAQVCHATLQQKVEVGPTLFFDKLSPDKDRQSEKNSRGVSFADQFCLLSIRTGLT